LIVNSGQSSDEAFRTIFGKEKPGRVRCHGRVTTPSLLKRSKEIGEIKKKHAIEVKNLSDKIQEMEVKYEKREKKHSKEMAAMEGKLQVLLRFMLNQSNSDQDMGDLAALLSTSNDDNNGLHSSTSAYGLNNHEVCFSYSCNNNFSQYFPPFISYHNPFTVLIKHCSVL